MVTNPLNGVLAYSSNALSKKNTSSSSNFALFTEKEQKSFFSTDEADTYSSTSSTYKNVTTASDMYTKQLYNNIINISNQSPYGAMADNSGNITYNGVTYQYSSSDNTLCLGDMRYKEDVLDIPLSGGDTLRVNRNNMDQLARSIGMFTPADQKRIMEAIYTDAKCRSKEAEIEENENKVLDSLFKSNSEDDKTSKEFD
ncbi:hypothetical protein [Anaerosporobacter sp.]|uniref:hypothetical protein n=1 Tax=Anaerosporobacter sp. TaxID=1872529 RepID=UPI00286EF640|nr:hypothetical protein [Anaerosporobacter sp.]